MARAKTTEPTATQQTAVSVFDPPDARIVLLDRAKFDRFYEDIKAETDKLEIDLTTEAGRKRIASMAFKVARTKTAIDDAGKLLTAEWREKISVVDAARREIRDRLDDLKTEVRAPLTAWEEAEESRLERVNATLANWREWATITPLDDSHTVAARLDLIKLEDVDSDEFGSHFDIAVALRGQTISALTTGYERLLKDEADREELTRLRREAEERALREQAEREAAEEKAREAEREAQRVAEIQAYKAREAERVELEKAEREAAIRRAKEEAEATARAMADEARLEQERAHNEALRLEKERADRAEAEIKASERVMAETLRKREEEAARLEAEQAARDRDRKHRGSVMGVAKAAMMGLGAEEDIARKIVLAIVAGEIPNVTLRF